METSSTNYADLGHRTLGIPLRDVLVGTNQVATALGMSRSTLAAMRAAGVGPTWRRVGANTIRYDLGGIIDWCAACCAQARAEGRGANDPRVPRLATDIRNLLVTQDQAAAIAGTTPYGLALERRFGVGPRWQQEGLRTMRYRIGDVLNYCAEFDDPCDSDEQAAADIGEGTASELGAPPGYRLH